jgi:hypothetical protein
MDTKGTVIIPSRELTGTRDGTLTVDRSARRWWLGGVGAVAVLVLLALWSWAQGTMERSGPGTVVVVHEAF